MPGFPDASHAYRIAVNELRIGWRKVRGKSRVQLAAAVVAALFALVFTAAAAWGAHLAGQTLADDPSEAAGLVGLVPAALATFTTLMAAYLTAIQIGDIDARDGYLTTVPARDVVGGLLLAGYVRVVGYFAGPLVVAAAAFAVGANAPLAFPLAALALFAVTATSFLVGFPVGVGAAYVAGRSALFERYKSAFGAAAFLAYFGLVVTGNLDEAFGPLVEFAESSPVAWYADLGLLTVVPSTSPLKAAAVLVGSVALAVGGVLASVRLSERRWYTEAVQASDGETDSVSSGRLDSLVGRRTAWVARKSWLRARRAPIKLVYVAYPAFLLVTPIQASVEAGRVTAALPPAVALYGAWMTGAAFTLNPLGDEGAVLPVTATTSVSGREFVGGLVTASAGIGLPVTLAVTVVLAVLSPMQPLAAACVVAAAAILPLLAAGTAVGVGTEFPKYDATSISRNREVVVPSMWAFAIYTLAFLFTAGIATAFQTPFVAETLQDAVGVSTAVVHVGSLVLGVLLAGAAAVLGVRVAIRAFDDFTMDDRS
jgi:ABC-2 type transport system permease protein